MGVAGLTHDHVHNVMRQFKKGQVIIAGIAESDQQLIARYKKVTSCRTRCSITASQNSSTIRIPTQYWPITLSPCTWE
ncbi:hypothetical protein ACQ86N_04760 [Puia sp. P3]|uniref:hypothetical protein n=1 Tax=Puia sp. P3 TaxID=3423952 RepID=UPI003D678901